MIKDMVTGLIDLKKVEELKEQMGMDIFKLLLIDTWKKPKK